MLTAEERVQVEKRLAEERESTVAALREFDVSRQQSLQDSTGELTMYRFHPADIGSEAMEQETQFLLASVEGRRLYAIDAALRRLYAEPEQFGACERCGGEIGMDRFDVVPWASLCAECQRTLEATTGGG